MKKILKITAIVFALIIATIALLLWSASEPLPQGETGPAAEALADKMLQALNKPAYDSLEELTWSFPRGHSFVWDKSVHQVKVQWADFTVDLQPNRLDGVAYQNGEELSGTSRDEAIQKAWALFANDSFWLVAPYKVRDPGTVRKLVETNEGPALLVTYSTGGVTPGDSYLWILDESGRPKAWKMWVSILPIKGLEFSWENWQQLEGAWFAPTHVGPASLSVDLTNLQAR
ncbi:MAG: hypothetical protein AAGA85_02035 [Bacteroidota bacterium]